MDNLSLANGAIPVLTPFFVGALKKALGKYEWFNNMLQWLPFAIAFGLTWIPGLGLAAGVSVGEHILVSAAAAGVASGLYETKKVIVNR